MTTPVNERIAADYRQRIRSGALPPGTRLPTVEQIIAEYAEHGTRSAMPVRQALMVLRAEGLIVFRAGIGNVVADQGGTE